MIQLQELRPYVAPKYVLQAHKERKKAIRERLREFTAVPPSQWFYEFCYCLCTPQSKATSAFAVAEKLQQQRFLEQEFDPTSLLRNPEHYIRFHNTKARTLLNLRTLFPSIHNIGIGSSRLLSGACSRNGNEGSVARTAQHRVPRYCHYR
jgi:thermostable 8-oxoguanine DNA glycosylase